MKANTFPSENRFRNNLRHKLEDAEMAPPAAVWEQIDAHLEQKRKRKGIIWWIGASASLVLLAGIGWLANQDANSDQAKAVAINPVWIHPTPTSKNKAAIESNKVRQFNKHIEKKSGSGHFPPAFIHERPMNPVRSMQRPVNQVALNDSASIPNEQKELTTLPQLTNLLFPVTMPLEVASGTSLVPDVELETEQPEQKSRKVYGIGFGSYKLKISLASKE